MHKLYDVVEVQKGTQGKIVYIEDDLVYIELDNGSEQEYDISDLNPVGTYAAEIDAKNDKLTKKQTKSTASVYHSDQNPLINEAAAFIVKEMKDLLPFAERFHNEVNDAIGQPHNWDETNDQQKLNMLAGCLEMDVKGFYASYTNKSLGKFREIIVSQLALAKSLQGQK